MGGVSGGKVGRRLSAVTGVQCGVNGRRRVRLAGISRLSSEMSKSKDSPAAPRLFVDFSFPLDLQLQPAVQWKRPLELCTFPQFIVDGATRMDVCQGVLNDCWFLSALASVSLCPPLLKQVVPMEQSFQRGYTGCFSFRFWQYGQWVEVKVDDRLPTQNGQLIYLCSSQSNEFWSPLLEKAYAKLKGGYSALNMGFPHEALVDMTGGVTEVLMLQTLPQNLSSFLRPLLARGALINCANTLGPLEQKNEFGILFKHAYSVTGLETVRTKFSEVELVRVRNPWGKVEWEGPWSDSNGPEWSLVSRKEQMRLGRVAVEDGEFWMSVSDFRQNFQVMEVCHLSDETLSGGGATYRPWTCTSYHGRLDPLSSGAPQYHLTLLEEDDDPTDPELTCSFLVALMQKHTRQKGILLPTQLSIYKVRSETTLLTALDVSLLQPVLSSGLQQQRELVLRGCLAPGNYIIIPSTSEKLYSTEFLLRILTEKGNTTVLAQRPITDKPTSAQLVLGPRSVLPSTSNTRKLFMKHCKEGQCRPLQLLNLLTEIIRGGVFAGSEEKLCLEHCRSFVVLMDSRGRGQLDWEEFQALWDKFRKWTDIFMKFDVNKTRSLDYLEISPALTAAGLPVDEFVLQLIGLRYTEPDLTVSYPGFLYLLLKLDTMIRKFQSFDVVRMGTVSVNYRQWLHMTLYN
ncbi:calpain-1 catalytic subunit [Pygocentrus nattereri]|uniref:Calpain catalytic domain-containing protein n=1 Tax=Pygocentrus nattereri TaxID=42514 RepID=A0AAR2LDR1_PYGNA|nr:calpain-1 catalytic subunit [Pygocentrus nattereri]